MDGKSKRIFPHFTLFEKGLWGFSVLLIVVSFLLFDRQSVLTLSASLIGITSLIFCAVGNPIGQVLMIVFSLFYGVISYTFSYYGEMITYVGMSMPMAVISLISWLRHPYEGDRTQVKVARLSAKDWLGTVFLSIAVSAVFYFILKALGTANLLPSTVSVTTSFLAVCLTARRSPYYAAAYAANDVVLILLWALASVSERRYLSVVFCFCAFLANDIYGFCNWKRMEKKQQKAGEF